VHSHRPARQTYRLVEHARSFGIAGRRLEEGWDMLAVRQATLDAAARVRAGEPYLLEIVTSRYKEHVGVGEDFHFNYRTRETMDAALADHSNVFIMGQGVDDFKGIFGSTTGLAEKYGPKRVFDVPLMEEGMTGVAIGAALVGDYPITTHIRADFSFLAMNQI